MSYFIRRDECQDIKIQILLLQLTRLTYQTAYSVKMFPAKISISFLIILVVISWGYFSPGGVPSILFYPSHLYTADRLICCKWESHFIPLLKAGATKLILQYSGNVHSPRGDDHFLVHWTPHVPLTWSLPTVCASLCLIVRCCLSSGTMSFSIFSIRISCMAVPSYVQRKH